MIALLSSLSYYIHIAAGVSTLITGPIAIFYNFRDPRRHRLVGKIFYFAMIIVAISAIIGFLKQPGKPFFQFLLGISLFVLADLLRGGRSIFLMKGAQVNRFDWFYTALSAVNGVYMLAMSAWHFWAGTMVALPILFGVFGLGSASDGWRNWKTFRNPGQLDRLDWMKLHFNSMIGAFIASTTAFTVNAATFLPWWAQWFGPTLLLVPLQVYFGRKIKEMRAKTSVAG